MTDKQKNLIVRAITGFLYVAIVVTSFYRPFAMMILFALVTGMTIWEYGGLVNDGKDIRINRFISCVAGVYFFLTVAGFCVGYVSTEAFIPYLITVVYLMISELYTKAANPINNWAYTMLSQMYIALPLSMINVLAFASSPNHQQIGYNYLLPLSVFVFLWVSDTGAYCAGSLLGRHKLFPRISPAKSWEGCIGGGLFVLLAAWLISRFDSSGETGVSMLTTWQWLGLGLVVTVFGTLGDLVESLFKRTLGVKDSGNILPGHGGMLDRFDSALMAIPAAVIYIFTISSML
ncbi:MAG: phosphatidate cytidylyltransferase [Prevotella sp.]|nr:phosphatidate cytidylyltransferase [Prevotella sp.]